MEITKISQRMFETFGLEDKVLASFQRHHSDFVREYIVAKSDVKKQFKKDKSFFLGSLNILDSLKPIFERHGKPHTKVIPKRLDFYITHTSQAVGKLSGGEVSGYFSNDGSRYLIAKMTSDPFVLDSEGNLNITIAHEVQHFIKSLYAGNHPHSAAEKEGLIEGYYEKPEEIQAYALTIAKNAVNLLKEMYAIRIDNKGAEFASRILYKMEQTQNDMARTYLARSVLKFFTSREEKYGGKFNDEVKKRYYKAAWHNFMVLFSQFIDAEKQKLGEITSEVKVNWYKRAGEEMVIDEKTPVNVPAVEEQTEEAKSGGIYFDNRASYEERIKQKQLVEESLWARIQAQVPWKLDVSGAEADMGGVDATYDRLKDGTPLSSTKTVQLKAREYGGDDITMELIRPWRGKLEFTGRDGKINVDKYFCVDTKKTLRIIDGAYLKGIAQGMVTEFVTAYQKKSNLKKLRTRNGEVMVFKEPSEESAFGIGKVDKILVFVKPSTLKVSFQCSI